MILWIECWDLISTPHMSCLSFSDRRKHWSGVNGEHYRTMSPASKYKRLQYREYIDIQLYPLLFIYQSVQHNFIKNDNTSLYNLLIMS